MISAVFWLDWNAVKDVAGSCPLAAGGKNQKELDPMQLRSSSDNHKMVTRLLHYYTRNKRRHSL